MAPEFKPWPKIPRRNKPVVITEKIDGTNGIIHVAEDGTITAGSRNKWLTDSDNFGFKAWVDAHADELRLLGAGYHYGEWYGSGIQRTYGIDHKRFALFNVNRWNCKVPETTPPACCSVVPLLAIGFDADGIVQKTLDSLRLSGSTAVPGFMRPEGIVVYHTAAGTLQKVLLEGDDKPKGEAEAA